MFRLHTKLYGPAGCCVDDVVMQTYRELFGFGEFRALFGSVTIRYAATAMQGIALGTSIYAETGSALWSALAMFGPSAAQVVGALTLLSIIDRIPPRAALTATAGAYGLVAATVAIPGMSTAVVLAMVGLAGLVSVVGNGVQWGLLTEILPSSAYVLGRSVFTMSNGAMQIVGFGLGGALAQATSPQLTLLLAASAHLLTVPVFRFGLRERRPRATGDASVGATWRGNRSLLSSTHLRCVYLAMWVPNGLIVGCEAVFVPYVPQRAGLLFAASAAGMFAGDVLVARVFNRRQRGVLAAPLRLLLAAPYVLFAFGLPFPVAFGLVAMASVGYGSSLLLQERLLAAVPAQLSGHALALNSCGMLTMQAVGAAIAGGIATQLSAGSTMALLALASIAVTLVLGPGLRTPEPRVPEPRVPEPSAAEHREPVAHQSG
jgi:hypothetical protein